MEALLQLRMLPVLFILFLTKILAIQETVTIALTVRHFPCLPNITLSLKHKIVQSMLNYLFDGANTVWW